MGTATNEGPVLISFDDNRTIWVLDSDFHGTATFVSVQGFFVVKGLGTVEARVLRRHL